MDDPLSEKELELQEMLRRTARIASEIQTQSRGPDSIPHYSQIEGNAREIGQQLSRALQAEQTVTISRLQPESMACPDCDKPIKVKLRKRTIRSVDGPTEITEPVAHCRSCRRSFFPSA